MCVCVCEGGCGKTKEWHFMVLVVGRDAPVPLEAGRSLDLMGEAYETGGALWEDAPEFALVDERVPKVLEGAPDDRFAAAAREAAARLRALL